MPANKGFFLLKSKLTKVVQQEILAAARTVVKQAPLFRPSMPTGQSFNYSMTNCGDLGWVADRSGYRYQQTHPHTFKVFPAMPQVIGNLAIAIAKETGNNDFHPQSCLINLYGKGEKRVWSKLVGERVVFKSNRNMVVFVVLKKAYLLNISLGLILNQHE